MSATLRTDPIATELGHFAEFFRMDATRRLNPDTRAALGQFLTPSGVARYMASLSSIRGPHVRLLDPGAGVGSLTVAWLAEACRGPERPRSVDIIAYEIDDVLAETLEQVLAVAQRSCAEVGVSVQYTIHREDFITHSAEQLDGGLFNAPASPFHAAILNPPYRKIRSDSKERALLSSLGIETSNLYTAFVALALRRLITSGELIAITPRSFCNGPYFTPFRNDLLRQANLTHLHVFDARDAAFADDEVLQENIIFRVERGVSQHDTVCVEWSEAGDTQSLVRRAVPYQEIVRPDDKERFIHVVPDEWDARIAAHIRTLSGSLSTLGIAVSTGRVVDFRAKEHLRAQASSDTVPLLYPGHLKAGAVVWPKEDGRKPNALVACEDTASLLSPSGYYVLVKRFTSKEERRRVSAALHSPGSTGGGPIAIENHVNYYHCGGVGLPREIAIGLTGYLNSSLVDAFFRQFSGHTQVNATDLRKLPYPTSLQLSRIATRIEDQQLSQQELDEIIEEELDLVSPRSQSHRPEAEKRIAEAQELLRALGLPAEQYNERSALTLLALLDLSPTARWSEAKNPMIGVTPIMEFAGRHYGREYAPNTRETFRRRTLHQFQEAAVVIPNPDEPTRPVNSPAYCYQVPDALLQVIRQFDRKDWPERVSQYVQSVGTLAARYASDREMSRIPLRIREGLTVSLSPGGQNELIKLIVEEFCPRFTPGGVPLYIGDADAKWAFFDEGTTSALGIEVDSHGKMPDVVVHYAERNWLVLVEAVTSHGPIDAKRHGELRALFAGSKAPLVYVTAFLTRQAMNKYLGAIAWETEVWVAEAPSHMIHFNGERFLGPYE